MSQEIGPFLHRAGKLERTRLGALPAYRFHINEHPCLLVNCGIGLKRAAEAARLLVCDANVRLLISFGVAGAVQNDLQVGDVVIGLHTSLLDDGIAGQFLPLAQPSPAAQEAASLALQTRGARFFPGTILTTRGSQAVRIPPEGFIHPVLEMETAAIARIAAEGGIPLLALRAISDSAAEPLPFNIEEFTDPQQNLRIGRVIKAVFRHPQLLPHYLRLRRNVTKASENLAIALIVVLNQPLAGIHF